METIWNRGRGCSPERRPFAREPRIDRGRSAAPRPRFEAPRDGAQTPPPPTATPYGDTSPSKRIVAATVFVLGSTRVTLWLRRFVTQTPPAPVATLSGPSPTRIRARIRRVSAYAIEVAPPVANDPDRAVPGRDAKWAFAHRDGLRRARPGTDRRDAAARGSSATGKENEPPNLTCRRKCEIRQFSACSGKEWRWQA